ncbi:MAG: preprotein translocase subunit SecY [Thaumarchaeota archaeon]|nr:preprotein translocase subunit SecY [Nitrososphaerota archaeon]
MGAIWSAISTVASVFPQVPKPERKPGLSEKLVWTATALVLYLAMAQTPLYGIASGTADQLAYTRIIFASAQGTLMELGIGPIVTAGLILQLLKGAEIIKLDFKKPEEKALFSAATKVLTLIVTIVEVTAFMIGGQFGTNLSTSVVIVIMTQLLATGFVVVLLDELVQKGWGIGSGISLFIMAGVAQQIIWNMFSVLPAGDGYLGIVPYLVNATATGHPESAIFRSGQLPSLFILLLTFIAIIIIVYVEGIRIEVPITSTKYRGFSGVYPMKLLYVSNIPVILASALLANLMFFSQFIWSRYNPNNSDQLLNLIATYNPQTVANGPIGGFLYYITPPRGLEALALEPLRAITYVAFYVVMAIIFGRIWVEIGGLNPRAVSKSLLDANVQVPGFRRSEQSVEGVLGKYIPVITILGATFIGLLASVADLFGLFGTGTGILLMVDITLNYYKMLMKERLETMMPQLAGLLGKT